MTFMQGKPDFEKIKKQGLSYLNLDGLKTKTSTELEAQNDDFIFEPNREDDGSLFGYYVALSYYTANEAVWRNDVAINGYSAAFSIDLDEEDYGSMQSYLDNLQLVNDN